MTAQSLIRRISKLRRLSLPSLQCTKSIDLLGQSLLAATAAVSIRRLWIEKWLQPLVAKGRMFQGLSCTAIHSDSGPNIRKQSMVSNTFMMKNIQYLKLWGISMPSCAAQRSLPIAPQWSLSLRSLHSWAPRAGRSDLLKSPPLFSFFVLAFLKALLDYAGHHF